MGKSLNSLINFYQRYFSPDHSHWGKKRYPYGYCRFHPSCSEYSRLAIGKYGLGKGLLKSVWRVLRCNPYSGGGVDHP